MLAKNLFSNTYILYILIVLFSSFFAFCSNACKRKKKKRSFVLLIFSFVILAFYATCSGVGIDRDHYMYFFTITEKNHFYSGFEPLFNCIIVFIKNFTDNPKAFVMIIGFMTILFVFVGIFINRYRVDYGFSVLIFSALYYFQSYNLMRIYFALSILVMFSYLLFKEKYFSYLIVTLFCTFIHYSCIFVLIVALLMIFFEKTKHTNCSKYEIFILTIIVFAISFFSKFIVGPVLSLFPSLYLKYSEYLNYDLSSFGFGWIFNVFPFLLLVFLAKTTNCKNAVVVSKSFYIGMLFLSILGYFVTMVQRASILMGVAMIMYIPFALDNLKKSKKRLFFMNLRFSMKTLKMSIFVYYMAAFALYLSQYMDLDQINNYIFIWEMS